MSIIKCPECGENVSTQASACPHCGAPIASGYTPSGEQVRPWVRFCARGVDNLLVSFLVGFVLGLIYEPVLEMPDILLGIIVMFVYVFVEPAMLAGWGTTPGKALLRVRLRNSDGSKLSYTEALSRAFLVWFRGEGFGIPIIGFFTQIHAYNRLTKQGITSWDEDGNFTVSHQVIGTWRVIVAVLLFIGMVYLITL